MISFLCRLSFVLALSTLLISAQVAAALELGLGASVRLGVQEHKTILQQIEDIKNHPEKKDAFLRFFQAPPKKEVDALATCTHLESLKLVIDKFPSNLNLKPLVKLSALNKLTLVFDSTPPDLQFLTALPALTKLEIHCYQGLGRTAQGIVQIPPLQTIRSLDLSGGELRFQFDNCVFRSKWKDHSGRNGMKIPA